MGACPLDDGPRSGVGAERTRAFLEFYDESARTVLRYFGRATGGNKGVAEDLCQETFLAAASTFDRDGVVPSVPWLMAVARNKLCDHYRKVTRDNRNLRLAWSERPWTEHSPAVDELDGDEIRALLSRLSDDHRVLLFLRYFEDRSVNEIAATLGTSVRAVESALARARRSLARNYAETRHG
ncbi:MAG: polymerase sigma-70 factor, subfamily [Ilumatobacteraceae bacterium]|jgi:RNA polymerase sigma-70 factor (ECF subfamily)